MSDLPSAIERVKLALEGHHDNSRPIIRTADALAIVAALDEAVGTFEDIVNPVAAMQRNAAANGHQLDGMMANRIANDPEQLRAKARTFLAKMGGAK